MLVWSNVKKARNSETVASIWAKWLIMKPWLGKEASDDRKELMNWGNKGGEYKDWRSQWHKEQSLHKSMSKKSKGLLLYLRSLVPYTLSHWTCVFTGFPTSVYSPNELWQSTAWLIFQKQLFNSVIPLLNNPQRPKAMIYKQRCTKIITSCEGRRRKEWELNLSQNRQHFIKSKKICRK